MEEEDTYFSEKIHQYFNENSKLTREDLENFVAFIELDSVFDTTENLNVLWKEINNLTFDVNEIKQEHCIQAINIIFDRHNGKSKEKKLSRKSLYFFKITSSDDIQNVQQSSRKTLNNSNKKIMNHHSNGFKPNEVVDDIENELKTKIDELRESIQYTQLNVVTKIQSLIAHLHDHKGANLNELFDNSEVIIEKINDFQTTASIINDEWLIRMDKISEMKGLLIQKDEYIDSLKEEIRLLNSQIISIQNDNFLQNKIASLSEENFNLIQKIEQIENMVSAQRKEIENKDKFNFDLNEKYEIEKLKSDNLKNELKNFEVQYQNLKKDYENIELKKKHEKVKIIDKEKTIDDKTQSPSKSQDNFNQISRSLRLENDNLINKISIYEEKLRNIDEQNSALQNHIKSQKSIFLENEKELNILKLEKTEMLATIEELEKILTNIMKSKRESKNLFDVLNFSGNQKQMTTDDTNFSSNKKQMTIDNTNFSLKKKSMLLTAFNEQLINKMDKLDQVSYIIEKIHNFHINNSKEQLLNPSTPPNFSDLEIVKLFDVSFLIQKENYYQSAIFEEKSKISTNNSIRNFSFKNKNTLELSNIQSFKSNIVLIDHKAQKKERILFIDQKITLIFPHNSYNTEKCFPHSSLISITISNRDPNIILFQFKIPSQDYENIVIEISNRGKLLNFISNLQENNNILIFRSDSFIFKKDLPYNFIIEGVNKFRTSINFDDSMKCGYLKLYNSFFFDTYSTRFLALYSNADLFYLENPSSLNSKKIKIKKIKVNPTLEKNWGFRKYCFAITSIEDQTSYFLTQNQEEFQDWLDCFGQLAKVNFNTGLISGKFE